MVVAGRPCHRFCGPLGGPGRYFSWASESWPVSISTLR